MALFVKREDDLTIGRMLRWWWTGDDSDVDVWFISRWRWTQRSTISDGVVDLGDDDEIGRWIQSSSIPMDRTHCVPNQLTQKAQVNLSTVQSSKKTLKSLWTGSHKYRWKLFNRWLRCYTKTRDRRCIKHQCRESWNLITCRKIRQLIVTYYTL